MKLHFLEAQGAVPFRKTVGASGPRHPSPPAVWRSHDVEMRFAEDLDLLRKHMLRHASLGHGLLRGSLRDPLYFEPVTHRLVLDPTSWMVVEFNRLPATEHLQLPVKPAQLLDVAEQALRSVHPYLDACQSLIQATTSFGLDPTRTWLRAFIPLREPVSHHRIAAFLRKCAMNSRTMVQEAWLDAGGATVSFPLDLHANEPRQVLCLAEPLFEGGAANPFDSAEDRFAVYAGEPSFDFEHMAGTFDMPRLKEDYHILRGRIRVAEGRSPTGPALRTTQVEGDHREVVVRPDPVEVSVLDDGDAAVVWLQVNEDDASGWHILRSNPRHVRNLAGLPWLATRTVAPELAMSAMQIGSPPGERTVPRIFMDVRSNVYHALIENVGTSAWEPSRGVQPIRKQSMRDFMRANGHMTRDLGIQEGRVEYDPFAPPRGIVREENGMHRVNLWDGPTERPGDPKVGFEDIAHLESKVPHTMSLLHHLLGGDELVLSFVNWLAGLWHQSRVGTGWILQAMPDAGQHALFHHLLAPLFGKANVAVRRMNELNASVSDFLGSSRIVAIDGYVEEPRLHRAWWTMDSIRSLSSSPTAWLSTTTVSLAERSMHAGFILCIHAPDAVQLPPTDRSFNVAPMQHSPWPGDRIALEAEAGLFRSLLMVWRFDRIQAAQAVLGAPRSDLIAGGEGFEGFVAAVIEGDCEYFEPILLNDPRQLETETEAQAQRYVSEIVWTLARDMSPLLTANKLSVIYHVMFPSVPTESVRAFTQRLRRAGVARTSTTNPLVGKTQKGTVIRWEGARMARETYATHKTLIDTYIESEDA